MSKIRRALSSAVLAVAAACGFGDKPHQPEVTPVHADSVAQVRAFAQKSLDSATKLLQKSDRELSLLSTTAFIDAQRRLNIAHREAVRLPASDQELKREIEEGKMIIDVIRDFRQKYKASADYRGRPQTLPSILQALTEYEKNLQQFPLEAKKRWKAGASVYQLTDEIYLTLLASKPIDDQQEKLKREVREKAVRLYQDLQQ